VRYEFEGKMGQIPEEIPVAVNPTLPIEGGTGFGLVHPGMAAVSNLRVLVVEDDPDLALTLERYLHRSGMTTAVARNGADAALQKQAFSPDVVLVDLELPDIRGDALVRWLAEQGDCGIIVVSGQSEDTDRILSLETGADDYIMKPANLRELVARIRSVHRRARVPSGVKNPAAGDGGPTVRVGQCTVCIRSREVRDARLHLVDLTGAEFAVLEALIEANGKAVSRQRLAEIALRRSRNSSDRGVDQLVFGLRRKLAPEDDGRRVIQSIRNEGYLLTSR
jgi:DNA-binding response OmpR family regulator